MMRRRLMMQIHSQRPRYWLDANRTDDLRESDIDALSVFYARGLCANPNFMTWEEAGNVVNLPIFQGKTKLKWWDWAALSNLNNTSLVKTFSQCTNLEFDYLPKNFAENALTLSDTFYNCTKLALTELPEDFAKNATNTMWVFQNCTKLALTSLPANFCRVSLTWFRMFQNCKNLALTSLPANFGSVATNMQQAFDGCTNLALTELPANFGSVATNMSYLFFYCTNLALTELPANFGSVATNLSNLFRGCTNLALTELPANFGSVATNMSDIFYYCRCLNKHFSLNNERFGRNCTIFYDIFYGTNIIELKNGAFDFSSVSADSIISARVGLVDMFPNTLTIVSFVPNTLKFSINSNIIGLSNPNLTNESLFSFVECLFDFYDEELGEFVGNEGKYWQPTTAQKTILENTDYEEGYTYAEYVTDKGWELR